LPLGLFFAAGFSNCPPLLNSLNGKISVDFVISSLRPSIKRAVSARDSPNAPRSAKTEKYEPSGSFASHPLSPQVLENHMIAV
jgi:hypothetical protein